MGTSSKKLIFSMMNTCFLPEDLPIFLSRRPGRNRAGSSVSGRFVAMIILTWPRASNPSIWFSNWKIYLGTSNSIETHFSTEGGSTGARKLHNSCNSSCSKNYLILATPTISVGQSTLPTRFLSAKRFLKFGGRCSNKVNLNTGLTR